MEDSTNPGADLDHGTTTNDSVAEPTTPASESADANPHRSAVLKAFEKLEAADPTDKPKGAMPQFEKAPKQDAPANVDPVTGQPREVVKAPGSLTPAQREKWATLDPEWQKHFVERDKDISQKLQESAADRKLAADVKEAFQPYEALFRQHGTTGVAHVKELMNMSYILNTGTGSQKAQALAQMILHFKPDADALRHYLTPGAQQQPAQAPAAPQKSVDELVEAKLAQREQAALEKQFVEVAKAFRADPKNEFFDDVRPLMEEILNSPRLTRGNTHQEVIQNAYNLACSQHEGVSAVMAQRAAASAIPAPVAAQARPTGSVKPSMGTGVGGRAAPAKSMTHHEAASAAWDKHFK